MFSGIAIPAHPESPIWCISVPVILHMSAKFLIVAESAPSCDVPIEVKVSTPD